MKKFLAYILTGLAVIFLAAGLVFALRQVSAKRQIEAEWQNAPTVIPELAATSHLEIIPLYEEAGELDRFTTGHGVSYLIRTDAATLLFDVGNNPDGSAAAPFMQNLQALGIAWDEIDRIVISHPHPDHIGGTTAWTNHTLAMGDLDPAATLGERDVFVPTDLQLAGAIHATIPTLPASDVATTGVISYPEVFPLSLLEPVGHEQALVIHVSGQGLVLITGCGHPGLERLVERAEMLYGQTVVGVVGGLHYENQLAQELAPHIQFLQERQPVLVALSPHDDGPEAQAAFQSAFGEKYHTLGVGQVIHIP